MVQNDPKDTHNTYKEKDSDHKVMLNNHENPQNNYKQMKKQAKTRKTTTNNT